MASQAGFEPATSPLGGARAIQLCHWDVRALYKNTNKNKQLMSSPATTEVQFGPFSADNRCLPGSKFHFTIPVEIWANGYSGTDQHVVS